MYIPKRCAASRAVTRFFDFLFPRSPRAHFKIAAGFEISASQPLWNDRPRGIHIHTGRPDAYQGRSHHYGPSRLYVRDSYRGGYQSRNDYRGSDDPYYDPPYER